MKIIYIILLSLALSSCQAISRETPKTLDVAEADIERKIAGLKFCEAIFKTDLFNLTEEEKLIHSKKCYLSWTTKEEDIMSTNDKYPESTKRLLKYTLYSREVAQDKGWLKKSKSLYENLIEKESFSLMMSDACKAFILAGDYNYDTEAVNQCFDYANEKYLLEKTTTLIW